MDKKRQHSKKGESYTCKTCGNISSSKGHLCSPIPQEKTTVCMICGKIDCNAEHVCSPKVLQVKYSCKNCGRSSIAKNVLCSPVKITQGKGKTAKKEIAAV